MVTMRKMTDEEVQALKNKKGGVSERAKMRQEYREYLGKFSAGDWVTVDLEDGEKRSTVRNRLLSAAKDLGFKLNFSRSREGIRFEIQKA